MGATYTRGFPNPIVWPLGSCSQLKSHTSTYARGATYTRVITVYYNIFFYKITIKSSETLVKRKFPLQ